MLGRLVWLLVQVALSATQCEEAACVGTKSSRIMGGDITERHTRPFQVALYLRVGTTGPLGFCGGALLHPQWVVTVAHCCFHDGQQVDHVQAILGAHSLYDRYENGRRVVNVDAVVLHPDFEPATFSNDLALLRLANTVQLSETIAVVRLPYLNISSFNFAGLGATVSGWGIAAPTVTFVAPTLREKIMTVMTDPLCKSHYFNQLPENTVCGFNMNAGTCKFMEVPNVTGASLSPYTGHRHQTQGDNGGPMTIIHNATEETILIGVASFVDASGCNEDSPSVFTRVQRFLPWITQVTGVALV